MVSGGASGYPQVVQTTGSEHDFINEAMAPVAEDVGDDVAAFGACNGMFDGHPHSADDLVDGFLDRVQFASAWFLLGLERRVCGGS